jgi:hypothetical protein
MGFYEKQIFSCYIEETTQARRPIMHLTTLWYVDTPQNHDIEIVHRRFKVANMTEAAKAETRVKSAFLEDDGTLTVVYDTDMDVITDKDVTIRVYTRPMDQRGKPFIPDLTTEEGLAQIAATFEDPAYIAKPDEFVEVNISLAELATIPGAVGNLGPLAYGMRDE